jgi:uncharacterized LabA/DUF88 family protein
MSKRVCIFVDGENLRHSIVDLFPTEFDPTDHLPKTDWSTLFDELSQRAIGTGYELVRAYWHVVQYLEFFPYGLNRLRKQPQDLQKVLSKYPQFKQELDGLSGTLLDSKMNVLTDELENRQRTMRNRFDGWNSIHNAIALRNRSVEFRPSGAIRYNLFDESLGKEKAVDVKLATDMIVLGDIYDCAVIVSGDQDYVPAVQHVKDMGKRVVNVSFRTRSGKLLPGGARRLNQMTDWSLCLSYDDTKMLLHL